MIIILNYLIMIEQPAYHFNNFIFRVIDHFHKFFSIRVLFTKNSFNLLKNQIKLIFAQIQLVSFTANTFAT